MEHKPDLGTARVIAVPNKGQADEPVVVAARCVCGLGDWEVCLYDAPPSPVGPATTYRQTVDHLAATGTAVRRPEVLWRVLVNGRTTEMRWDGPGDWVRSVKAGHYSGLIGQGIDLAAAEETVHSWAEAHGGTVDSRHGTRHA